MSPPATTESRVQRAVIKINGAPLPPELEHNLFDIRVRLVGNGVSEATLRFYDPTFELDGSPLKLAALVEIAFEPAENRSAKVVFSGEIMELGIEQGPTDQHELVVTAFDKAHRLMHVVAPAVYVEMTYGDIIKKLATEANLRASVRGKVSNMRTKHLYRAGAAGSLLDMIAERCGAFWRVVGDELVVDSDPPQPLTVHWGRDLRRFNTRMGGAGATKQIQVRGWDPARKQPIVGVATEADSDWLSQNGMTPSIPGAISSFTGTRLAAAHVVATQDEATALAESLRTRADAALTQARGEVLGHPDLVPGGAVRVEGMGSTFSGTYRLTAVEHVCTVGGGYVTRFVAGGSASPTLPNPGTSSSRAHGPMIGIVTNNKDPDNMGRVRVKLPELTDDVETDWARVVSAGAGANRGFQITPAVNDEVLVVFEHGDIRRPVVLGGLWNGYDSPPKRPEEAASNGEVKLWHVQTKAGHILTFSDDAQQPHVKVMLQDGKTLLYLGEDKVQLIANNTPLEIKTGQSSIVMANNQIDIQSMNVNLKATANLKVEANANINVKAGAVVQAEGSATAVLKGGASTSVESGGMTAIRGGVVKIN